MKSIAKDVMAKNLVLKVTDMVQEQGPSRTHSDSTAPVYDERDLLVYFLATRHFDVLTVLVIMKIFYNPQSGFSRYQVEYFFVKIFVFAALNKGVQFSGPGLTLCTFDAMIERA